MKKEIKKEQCVCEKLKERVRRFPKEYTTLGEEVKDWTCINFGLDEEYKYLTGAVITLLAHVKATDSYALLISSEFDRFDIPINYCPFCGRKLTNE